MTTTISTYITNGIYIANDGNILITNTGTIAQPPNAGFVKLIYGRSYANHFTITNQGTLLSNFVDAAGIFSRGSGTVFNSGIISAVGSGADGIYLYGKFSSISNSGTIIGDRAIVTEYYDTYVRNSGVVNGGLIGIGLYGGGSFANTGTIFGKFGLYSSYAVAGTNIGIIDASQVGVEINGGSILNSGTIIGGQYAVANNSGAFTLGVDAGAVFEGVVYAAGNLGLLKLEGTTAGSLNMDGTFNGFSGIAFGSAAWTLEGTTTELANGEIIAGFNTPGDSLILDSFAATSYTLSGSNIILSNGTTTETIKLARPITASNALTLTSDGADTTLTALVSTGSTLTPATTISTDITNNLYLANTYLGNSTYAVNIIITNTGDSTTIYGNQHVNNFTVTNLGTVSNQLGGGGIISNGSGKVINSGIISIGGYGEGVYVRGLSSSSVINSGTIKAYKPVVISDNGGYVYNSGLLKGGISGIALYDGGIFTNTGTISAPEGAFSFGGITATNSGIIDSKYAGIYLNGGMIRNSGTISGRDAIYNKKNDFALGVNAGAVFKGAVIDKANTGVLNLEGTTAGSLNLNGTFTGFSSIAFGDAAWTLEGTTAELAAGQTITGFTSGDQIVLDGFAATYETFVAGTGLVLSNGTTSETLDLAGGLFFAPAQGATTTTLAAGGAIIAPGQVVTATGSIASATLAGGTLDVSGATTLGTLAMSGTGATITFSSGAVPLTLASPLTIAPGATLDITGGTLVVDGSISLTGAITESSAYIVTNGGLINNDTITLDPSTLTVDGSLTGTGVVTIGADSTLEVTGDISSGQTIVFEGTGAVLAITDTADIAGTISFLNGSTIDIAGLTFNANTTLHANSSGTLAIPDAQASGGMIDLTFSGIGSSQPFILTSDGQGGTDLALCYLSGTQILTPTGEKPIESLNIGDLVVTRFGGFRPIKWIGRQTFNNTVVSLTGQHRPVKIHAGALGPNLPARDLSVSPGHSMLIDNTLVLASTLVNGVTITQDETPEIVDYYQLDLGTHDCVIAEGTWSESFADGPDGTLYGLRSTFHNVEEFYQLYPDEPPAAELILCAPRPLTGSALEAIITPVITRAAALTKPGALEGWVETVSAGWYVEGWAIDTANPNLPVQFDIYLGDRLLGSTLACNHRPDLQKAGKGRGHCAFRFTSPVKLTQAQWPQLRVQHSADFTAALPLSSSLITPAGALRLAS